MKAADGSVAMNKQDERELLAACLAWACLNQPDMKNLAKLLTLAIANSASTASSDWKNMWAYACELAEQFRDEHDEKHFMITPINKRGWAAIAQRLAGAVRAEFWADNAR